ncbi:MAG: PTS fructose transporter subunit IIBC [Enterobacteriaceae bacterium]
MLKTFLIMAPGMGQARRWLIQNQLAAVAHKTGIEFVDNAAEATLVLMVGDNATPETALYDKAGYGKKIYRGSADEAIQQPALFLSDAKNLSVIYLPAPTDTVATLSESPAGFKRLLAVTACPTGVAHTFMAAEAISSEAHKRGWQVKVETRGSVGAGNAISPQEIEQADLIIIAADIDVDLSPFVGKPLYRTSTALALKKTAQEFDNALTQAAPWQALRRPDSGGAKVQTGLYRHLLTGVSYMLPMVVAGGLLIALSFAFGIEAFKQEGTLAAALMTIGGGSAFALMVPVLAGYIAFSIADRPGLTPGLIGGMLATSMGAGFLGGIIAGFLAGYVAKTISTQLKLPTNMEALKPILIIPLFSSLIVGLVMIYLIGAPIATLLQGLSRWLETIGTANAIMLGAILGGMMCSDMGGPINKAAYTFGVGLLSAQSYAPMAAIMAAGMVPPLAMGLATLVARRKFSIAERDGGKAAMVLGLCFITEGAIPFAARDPLRVLPCCMVGGAVTGAISMAIGAKLMAPHGGLFVLLIPGAITPVLGYLCAIMIGTLLSGLVYAILKQPERL